MRVTKRLMAALLACLMLLSLLPVPAYAADDGRIALLAVAQDGYVIEPEYIGYHDGDTVKDVLKNSGHTFSGIDSGFITAVDGRTDNYSLHYDGDGYALDASAKGLTAIWFTTNANQSYGENLLHLAERMAAYNTSTNGLKDYAAAKEAYDAAHSGFYAAANAAAAPLRTALENAIEKFETFQAGDRVTVTIAATQDGNAVTPAQATFTSEFGTVTTVKNAGSVQLVPATYQFDLSDGGINHVRGTVEVTAQGAAVSAPLPSGKWIKELRLGIDNQWKDGEDVPKLDETDGGATSWVPDYSYGTLYPYMVPGDGIGTAEGQTYSIRINKLPPVETTVTTDPADATVFLTSNVNGQRILPGETGTYTLDTNGAYTLVVTRSGYVGQKLDVIAGENSKNITVKLDKAPESTHNDILQPGDWPLFRADSNNNGVVSAPTPITAEDAVLVWANKVGEGYGASAASCPIIAGGYLYAYARDKLLKIDKDTGAVVGQGTMVTSSSFAINSPTYADGMIFVALSGGRIQAFDAESLESLWVYTDPLGGQPNCPIAYCDGYIYTGFWNSETKQANFAGISVTDEDPTQPRETKLAAWTYTHNGFYWAGAYACENFVLVTTDDGDSGYTTGYGSVLSLDPKTGVLLDQLKATNVGDLRSSVCYDPATDAYYFTSKGGDLYQVRTNEDGTFVKGSLNRLHLDNGGNDDNTPPMSTSTPVIHNGRAYIGVSGVSQFGAYSGHNMTVVDLESFSIAYTVPTQGYPQTSGLLTTAYEDQDGYAYVYFFDNYTPGKLRVLRDKPGMTEVDHTYTTMETYNGDSGEVTIETGYVLFTPSGAQAQYAICSPIVDGEGNIYFKNDSAYMMRLSSRVTALEITRQPERTVYEIGETFDGAGMQVTALLANGMTQDVTDYVKFTAEPLTAEDTEITVSLDLTRLDIPGGPNWVFYQNRDGQAGQEWTCPTGTVNIDLKDGHVYGQPVWTWNDDFSAYAEFACTVNPRHEKLHLDAQVTSEVTTGSSCLEGGVRTYTAKVVLDGVTYTDVRTQPIPADGHKLSAVAEVPAACTENGVKAHWVCSVCGQLFSDAEGQNETTLEALTIPATGHKTQLVGAKAATCTEDGYTGDEVCTVCGETVKKGEVIPATGHKTELVGAKAATCTQDGYTGDQVCTVCNEVVKKGEVIPATGHKTELVGAKAAACTEDGYTGDEVCTVCNEVVKKGETIPATGHDYKDGKCTVCGETDPNYKPDEPVQPENPGVKTGDEAHTALWLAAASVSLLAAAALLLGKKKHLS